MTFFMDFPDGGRCELYIDTGSGTVRVVSANMRFEASRIPDSAVRVSDARGGAMLARIAEDAAERCVRMMGEAGP